MSKQQPDHPRQDRPRRTTDPERRTDRTPPPDTAPDDEEGRRRVHEGTDESRGVW